MTSFIRSAKFIHDVDTGVDFVEFIYDRYVKNIGYEVYTDYIFTRPIGDWTVINSKKCSIPYEKFLDTMVEKTTEVYHKMAEILIDNILVNKQKINTHIRMIHTLKILDSTFQPPFINPKVKWQRDMIVNFCLNDLRDVIDTCSDTQRLKYITKVIKNIESDLSQEV